MSAEDRPATPEELATMTFGPCCRPEDKPPSVDEWVGTLRTIGLAFATCRFDDKEFYRIIEKDGAYDLHEELLDAVIATKTHMEILAKILGSVECRMLIVMSRYALEQEGRDAA